MNEKDMRTRIIFKLRNHGMPPTIHANVSGEPNIEHCADEIIALLQQVDRESRADLGLKIVGQIDKLRNAPVTGRKNPDDYWKGFSDLAFHLDEYIGKELAALTQKGK
jgi:hypothetical protein